MKNVVVILVTALGLISNLYSATAQPRTYKTWLNDIEEVQSHNELKKETEADKRYDALMITRSIAWELISTLKQLIKHYPKFEETFKEDIELLEFSYTRIGNDQKEYRKLKTERNEKQALVEKIKEVIKEIKQKVPAKILDHIRE
jgi:hypothetical protein